MNQLAPTCQELVARLDAAVATSECPCQPVREVLESIVATHEQFLPLEFLRPCPSHYARRLVHRDPQNRYSIAAMVWDRGQGTALHDHAGLWCVECVYRGRIRVTSYDMIDESDDRYRFREATSVVAGVGMAGALIPPFDYHTIENPDDSPAVTIHVYGGEMDWCHIFVPEGDQFRRETKELCYTA